ncbi:MAG: helix-turn-helix domain-containing protein [Macromonas sp.]
MADTRTPVATQRQQYINLDLVRHVMQCCALSGASRWILFTIATHADAHKRQCFCSLNTLARESGWSRRTVMQHIERLEALGFLACVGTHHSGTNIYQVQMEGWRQPGVSASSTSAPAQPATAAPAPAPAPVAAPVPSPAPPPPTDATAPCAAPAPRPRETCLTSVQNLPTPSAISAPKKEVEKRFEQPGKEEDSAINAETIGQLNAQRRRNGKDPLCHHDVRQLSTEATKVGLTPLAAAQWVLAKPQRNFFKADYYTPAAPPAPPHPAAQAAAHVLARLQPVPTPLTAEEQAAQAQAAQQARERVRAYLASVVHGKDGPTIRTRDGDGPTAPNMQWAHQAIALFIGGQTVSRYRLHTACEVLGIKLPATARPNAS